MTEWARRIEVGRDAGDGVAVDAGTRACRSSRLRRAGGDLPGRCRIIEHMFDDRGPAQRRNDRSGALQRTRVQRIWVDLAVAYPRPEDRPVRVFPEGVDLQSRVPGELLA